MTKTHKHEVKDNICVFFHFYSFVRKKWPAGRTRNDSGLQLIQKKFYPLEMTIGKDPEENRTQGVFRLKDPNGSEGLFSVAALLWDLRPVFPRGQFCAGPLSAWRPMFAYALLASTQGPPLAAALASHADLHSRLRVARLCDCGCGFSTKMRD